MIVMEIENGNYCVYVHTSPSGKMYVGQTGVGVEKRWGKNGRRYLDKKNNQYIHRAFARAINKYGWDNFQHEIVADNLTKEEADNFEKLLIKKLNTMNPKYGYNCKEGGSNGKLSEETRRKMSESTKGEKSHMWGKHLSEETKNKIKESRKDFRHSEETRKLLSKLNKGEGNGFYGKRHTEESLKKMSKAHKGKMIGANHFASRKVSQYDLSGNLIKIWDCMSEAGRELNINYHNIYSCCQNNRRTCGGFVWRYFEDELVDKHLAWCNEVPPDIHFRKCVSQYSLSGEFIRSFESMREAELATGVADNAISMCCRNERKTAGGFIWRYHGDEITDEYLSWYNKKASNKTSSKRIAQYSQHGELINIFESLKNASLKTGVSKSSIRRCCNGKYKTSCGFIWKYYDDINDMENIA